MFTGIFKAMMIGALVGIAFVVLLIALPSSRRRNAARRASDKLRPVPVPQPAPDPVPEVHAADPAPSVSFPEKYQDKNRVYFYPDVKIIGFPGGADLVVPGEPLSFSCSDNFVQLFQGSNLVGQMVENRLAGMVRDWEKAGDPVLGYVLEYSDDGASAMIALAFYQDLLAKFLKKHPGAKPYKLTGKPDDLAFGYEVGSRCSVESDFDDPEKYNVVFDGSPIGRLPASAVHYAEEQGYDPEDLRVIVASVDYDLEKEHDVISVYLD